MIAARSPGLVAGTLWSPARAPGIRRAHPIATRRPLADTASVALAGGNERRQVENRPTLAGRTVRSELMLVIVKVAERVERDQRLTFVR